jgi:hypothetical protein
MEQNQGQAIIELFKSIRQLFKDISLIIRQFDNSFIEKGFNIKWNSSAITKDNSTSLDYPERWLLEGIYRLYEKDSNIIYGFNISFRHGNSEPLFIAGKIEYEPDATVYAWELWDQWHDNKANKLCNINYHLESPKKGIKSCGFFAESLVSITGNDRIEALANKILEL